MKLSGSLWPRIRRVLEVFFFEHRLATIALVASSFVLGAVLF